LRVFSAEGKVVSDNFPEPMHQVEAETIKRSSTNRYISVRWWILELVKLLTKELDSDNIRILLSFPDLKVRIIKLS
jgi:hypothetical protein